MYTTFLCTVMILVHVGQSSSAKIALTPLFTRSHFIVMEKLALELHSRGHEVVIYVGEGERYAAGKKLVKQFKYREKMSEVNALGQEARKHVTDTRFDPVNMMRKFFQVHTLYCDSLISDSSAFNSLKAADIVIGDSLYPCSSLVADWLEIRHVMVMMSSFLIKPAYGLESPLSYIPQTLSGLTSEMGLWDRLINLRTYFVMQKQLQKCFFPAFKLIKDKYKIKPEKTIQESVFTLEFIIWTADFALERAQPLMPYVRQVGYFTPSPAQTLPAELEQFMQGSGDEGVILVSFGTYVTALNPDLMDVMATAFAGMPTKILWKIYPGSYPKTRSSNVKLLEWLPQNDVLGHNKTRLFITHAGGNGMSEAAYHGVPVVCSPFMGDQLDNARIMKDAGIGEILPKPFTAQQLLSIVNTVLHGESYKRNAARVSRVMKSRARTPVQEAADLVEYVQSVGNMDHLKPRGLFMPFYQVYMLDVMAVLAVALGVIIVLMVVLVRKTINFCFSSKLKAD